MRRVLLIHHLEPCWDASYRKIGGVSFEGLQERFLDYLSTNRFDEIILTRFEKCRACPSEGYYSEILQYISNIYNYGYGWTWDMFEDEDYDPSYLCDGGNHSECIPLENWMYELSGCEVVLTGAFDGECIEDMEVALTHLGINFSRENSLII